MPRNPKAREFDQVLAAPQAPDASGGSVIFLGVAALAGIIPAQRAARTPPAVALQAN